MIGHSYKNERNFIVCSYFVIILFGGMKYNGRKAYVLNEFQTVTFSVIENQIPKTQKMSSRKAWQLTRVAILYFVFDSQLSCAFVNFAPMDFDGDCCIHAFLVSSVIKVARESNLELNV